MAHMNAIGAHEGGGAFANLSSEGNVDRRLSDDNNQANNGRLFFESPRSNNNEYVNERYQRYNNNQNNNNNNPGVPGGMETFITVRVFLRIHHDAEDN